MKATTHAGYRNAIDVWIVPHIGRVLLRDLDRDHLIALYRKLRKEGGRNGKPLGTRSVQLVHTILRKALKAAVDGDKIP